MPKTPIPYTITPADNAKNRALLAAADRERAEQRIRYEQRKAAQRLMQEVA